MRRIWLRGKRQAASRSLLLVCSALTFGQLGCESVERPSTALRGHTSIVMIYEVRTSTDNNDAELRRNVPPPGSTWLPSLSTIKFGRTLTFDHDAYMRFPIDFSQIPRYAIVEQVYIEFEPQAFNLGRVNARIELLDSPNCPKLDKDQSGLGTDGAAVLWAVVPHWVVGIPVQSPDIADAVQRWMLSAEEIATPYIGFRFVEDGSSNMASRESWSATGWPLKSPLLHITYTLPPIVPEVASKVGARPDIIAQPIFRDDFLVRGGALPNHWTVPVGDFSIHSERYLEVIQPGELVYAGTPLNDLRSKFESDNANFAIVLRFFARENMKFEIRGRRKNDESHIAFAVDFETNIISLSDDLNSGGTLESTTHQLKSDGIRFYSVELWMHEEDIIGFINGARVISATSGINQSEMGFSLWVPEVSPDDPPIFSLIAVHDVIEQRERQLDGDPSNLFVLFRDLMRDQVDDWSQTNRWKDFVKARKHWHSSKNIGFLNKSWKDLGYPLHQPRSEEWYP